MALPAAHDHPPGHAHAHLHGGARGDSHGHSHGTAHGPARVHASLQAPGHVQPAEGASLLMAGAGARLSGVLCLLALLWLAVAWALGEPA